jgi:hypothetical protein
VLFDSVERVDVDVASSISLGHVAENLQGNVCFDEAEGRGTRNSRASYKAGTGAAQRSWSVHVLLSSLLGKLATLIN